MTVLRERSLLQATHLFQFVADDFQRSKSIDGQGFAVFGLPFDNQALGKNMVAKCPDLLYV